ncbi:MAG: class I SAM-dependent methyltransferase [Salinibacterium sp.]|nr:class I SAM-dependent methyltransferase [Salinibacterium sp.]
MKASDWDARYETAGVWSREPNAWIAATLEHLDPGTAVDLAAGEGRNALWLAGLGWEVTAVDYSAVGLATGKERATELGVDVEWVVADATTWVSPTLVDLVVIAYLQLPAEELSRAIGTAAGYLAPGGTLALINHDRDNLVRGVGGPQDPAVLATVEELTHAASVLDIVECRQVDRVTPNGIAIDVVLVARAH